MMMIDLTKMTMPTTNNLVNVLYLQWAYICTLIPFLIMSNEMLDGCLKRLVIPQMVTFLLAIYLFRSPLKKIVKTMMGSVKSRKKVTKKNDESSTEESETSSTESSLSSSSSVPENANLKTKMVLFKKSQSTSPKEYVSVDSVKSKKKTTKTVAKSSSEESESSSSETAQTSSSSVSKSKKLKTKMVLFQKDQSSSSEEPESLESVKSKKMIKVFFKSSAEESETPLAETSQASSSTASEAETEKSKTKMVLFEKMQP